MRVHGSFTVALVAATRIASADPEPAWGPPGLVDPFPPPRPTTSGNEASPAAAFAISAIGTALPLAAFGVGAGLMATHDSNWNDDHKSLIVTGALVAGPVLFFAPSFGHIYGENTWETTGARVRATGAYIMLASLLPLTLGFMVGIGSSGDPGPTGDFLWYSTLTLVGAGGATIVAGAIIDVATAYSATKRWNRKHTVSLGLAPTVMVTPSHATAPGFGVVGHF